MPTMSVFAFQRQAMQKAGPFYQQHSKISLQSQNLAFDAIWGLQPPAQSVVAYMRSDAEICQSLSLVVNNLVLTKIVDDQLAGANLGSHFRAPVRRGAIRTSYKPWGDAISAPSTKVANTAAHLSSEIINTINIDIHVNSDPIFTALSGTIGIYVFYFLDGSGRPHVRIEGFSTPVTDDDGRIDGGAAGQLSEGIGKMLSDDQAELQSLLERALEDFAGKGTYGSIYTLPGTGVTVGAPFSDNADNNAALCLVPNIHHGR